MREIKFRGFHEYINGKTVITVNGEKKRGEWVYGNLIKMNSSGGQSFIFPYYEFASTLSCRALISLDMVPVDISTVGQFTGLHDKNGKEIYEGDIVRSANGRCTATIKFGECCPPPVKRFCEFHGIETHKIYCLHAYDKNGEYLIEDNISFKVIGNIYDKEEINNG